MRKKIYNINEGFDFDSTEEFDLGHDIEIHNNMKTFQKVKDLLEMSMYLHKEHLLMDKQDLVDENFDEIFKLHIPVFDKDKCWSITLYDKFAPVCRLIKRPDGRYLVFKLNGRSEIVDKYEYNSPLPIEISRRIDTTFNKVKALVDSVDPEKLKKDFFYFARALTRKENFRVLASKLYPEAVSYTSENEIYFNKKGIRQYGIETITSSPKQVSLYGEVDSYHDTALLVSACSTSACTREELIEYIVKYVNPYKFYQFRDVMMNAVPEIFAEKINEAFDFDSEDDGGISDKVKSHAEIAKFHEILNTTTDLIKQWSSSNLADSFHIDSNNEIKIFPDQYILYTVINISGEDSHISLNSNDFSPITIKIGYGDYMRFDNLPLEIKLELKNAVKNINTVLKSVIDNPKEIKRMLSKIKEVKKFLESKKRDFWYSNCPYITSISGSNEHPVLGMKTSECGINGILSQNEDSYKVLFNLSLYTDYLNKDRLNPLYYKAIDFDSVAKTIMDSKSIIKASEVPAFQHSCIDEGLKTNQDYQNLFNLSISLNCWIEFPKFAIYGFKDEDVVKFKDYMSYIINSPRINEKDGHLSIYNVGEIFGTSKSVKEAKAKVLSLIDESIPKAIKYSKPTLTKFEKILVSFKTPVKIKMKRGIFRGSSEGFVYCLSNRDTLAFYKGNLYFGGKPKKMENIVEEVLQYFSGVFEEVSEKDSLIRERLIETLKESFIINGDKIKIRLGAISGKFCSIMQGNIEYGLKAVSGRLDFYRDNDSPMGVKVITLNVPPTEKTKDKDKAFELMLDTIPNSIDGKIPSNYKNIFYQLISYYD